MFPEHSSPLLESSLYIHRSNRSIDVVILIQECGVDRAMKREKLQWMKAKVGKNKDVYKECCIPFDIWNVNIILNAL